MQPQQARRRHAHCIQPIDYWPHDATANEINELMRSLMIMDRASVRIFLQCSLSTSSRFRLANLMHLVVDKSDDSAAFISMLDLMLEVDAGKSVFAKNRAGLTLLQSAVKLGRSAAMIHAIKTWESMHRVARVEFLRCVPIVGSRMVRKYFRAQQQQPQPQSSS